MGKLAVADNEHSDDLKQAFMAFNQLSEQLTSSYQELEEKVTHLNSELIQSQNERLQELAEKERLAERLDSLLNALPAGVVVLDAAGIIQQANPAALEMLGEPLQGQSWVDVISRCFSLDSDGYDLQLKSGRLVSLNTCPLGSEPGQILMLNDVTETRQLQEKVSREKRLVAMGEMAASLAHQIRTPLASALLYSSHLKSPQLELDKRVRFADKISDSIRHLEKLVGDMLIFARGEMGSGEDVAIAELMHTLVQAVEAQLPDNIELQVDEQSEGRHLRCNRDILHSALLNLACNAIEAMPEGGQLTLASRIVDGWLELMVRDTGKGIVEADQDKIFEPFFTQRSGGTGLGLAVVQAVVRAHRGEIQLHSVIGEGSRFVLRFPLSQSREGV
jgi:two-component system sensor histidine kinase FlrB